MDFQINRQKSLRLREGGIWVLLTQALRMCDLAVASSTIGEPELDGLVSSHKVELRQP